MIDCSECALFLKKFHIYIWDFSYVYSYEKVFIKHFFIKHFV